MNQGQKSTKLLFTFVLLAALLFSYYVSGLYLIEDLSIGTLEESLEDIFTHPFQSYWNEKSLPCMLLGFLGWLYFVTWYLYHNRNFMFGKEYGAAQWEDLKKLNQQLADKNPSKNRIVSANLEYSLEILPNNNMIVLGSPGTGKTISIVVPNLLRMAASYVILDVKGDLLYNYGSVLKAGGYRIKVLNLKEKKESDSYNPFRYLRSEEDIIKIIKNIQESTTPPDAMKGDPFWDDGVTMYLQALFFYVWYEIPYAQQSMLEIVKLVNYETNVLDENGTTQLSLMMENLIYGERGKEHLAYVNYKKLKGGAPETVASIILIVNTKLQLFEISGVRRIFEEDTLDLKEIGIGRHGDRRTKTALFLVIPDNDASFNFMISMLYTQLMDQLIYEADHHFHGKLPIPVEFWMDEYANGVRPYRFENLITTLRSRNISAILMLQSISQLKTLHKGEGWNIIMDACSVLVFLGAGRGALNTHEYISKLLGQATIDKRTEGEHRGPQENSNLNFDRMGRELKQAAEIGSMSNKECIVLIAGYGPVCDRKNMPFQQKAFQEAQAMKKYIHPIFCKKNEIGDYTTIKVAGKLEILNDESVAYYRQLKEKGENVNFYTIDDDTLLQLDFFKKEEIDLEVVSRYFHEHQREIDEMSKSALLEEEKDLSGDIFTCIKRYQEILTDEQMEEILSGLEAGLSSEKVKSYFFWPVEKMRQEKRMLLLERKE